MNEQLISRQQVKGLAVLGKYVWVAQDIVCIIVLGAFQTNIRWQHLPHSVTGGEVIL
jgi:hypothetical protein